MAQTRIAFFDTKPYDREFFEEANSSYGYGISFFTARLNEDTSGLAAGHDAVCVFVNDVVSAAVVNTLHLSGVRLLALRSAGYNNVDLRAIFGKIHVARVPEYSPHAVAEHTVALILSLNRKTHKAYYRIRDNNFSISGFLGFDLYRRTAGIVGTGKIGRVVIQILRGFGMDVLAYDPYPNHEFAKQAGWRYVGLDELYAQSDIVSLHCPLTPDNVHMIDARSIAKMKDGVMIINTGRGKLIDTVDLIAGLKSKKIGYAGLDVYEEETDYFFEDFSAEVLPDDVLARLLTFPNVLITSHQGFFTNDALTNIAHTTLENIKQFFAGEKMANEICYKCCDEGCKKKGEGKCF